MGWDRDEQCVHLWGLGKSMGREGGGCVRERSRQDGHGKGGDRRHTGGAGAFVCGVVWEVRGGWQ
eukprot:11442509-Prorocentrum_lima.AAC.1